MLFFNVLSIIVYTVSTAIYFKPVYCAFTLGAWILILELSILLVIKYRESNFNLTAPIVSICSATGIILLLWVIYIFVTLLAKDDEPQLLKIISVVTVIGYFLVMIIAFLLIQYQAIGANLRALSKSFYGMLAATFLVFITIGLGIYFKTELKIPGIIWIAVCFYVLLNLLLFRFKLYIDIVFTLGFVVCGVALLYTAATKTALFTGISVLYFGIFLLSFGSFVREYVKNQEKRRTSIFMHSKNVFPILEYSLNTQSMTSCNLEAVLFFTWIFVVLIWGFTSTVFCAEEYRYIPISFMAVSLSICYIYIISKQCSARSIDWKFFKQSTLVFYGSCLVTATESKQKWRCQDRNTKSMAGSSKGEEEFMDKSIYAKEL